MDIDIYTKNTSHSADLQILNALHKMFSDVGHMKVLRFLGQEYLEGNDISVTRTLSRIIV